MLKVREKKGKVEVWNNLINDYGVKTYEEFIQISSHIFEKLEDIVGEHEDFIRVDKEYRTYEKEDTKVAKGKLTYNIHEEDYGKLKINFLTRKKIFSTHANWGYSKLKIHLSIDKKQFDNKILNDLERTFFLAKEKYEM